MKRAVDKNTYAKYLQLEKLLSSQVARTANQLIEAPLYPELWEVRDAMFSRDRPLPSPS